MLRLGSHVSMKAPDMLLGSANEAASYGANTFMIYTGAPQNTRRKPIDELKIDEAQPIIEAHDLRQIVVHAPYIINLGNTKKPGYFEFATDFLYQEIQRADAVGATQLTSTGSIYWCRMNVAITQIIKGRNAVIRPEQHVQIAPERWLAKELKLADVWRTLDDRRVTYNEKLSVTLILVILVMPVTRLGTISTVSWMNLIMWLGWTFEWSISMILKILKVLTRTGTRISVWERLALILGIRSPIIRNCRHQQI